MRDLADFHYPLSNLFARPNTAKDWDRYRLTTEQIEFFQENGFLAGIQLLDENQIAVLSQALDEVMDPKHPLHGLFHEFHSNESADPNTVLFHSLGHWRIAEAFHRTALHHCLEMHRRGSCGQSGHR